MRFQHAANRQALEKASVRVATFLFLDFDDPVRLNSSPRDVVTGGRTWLGKGALGGVDVIGEDTELNGAPIKINLSGVDPDLVPSVLVEDYRNRRVEISLGFFSQDWTLLAPPELLWEGVIDSASVAVSSESAAISLTCENQLAFLIGRPIPVKYTDQEQRKRFPGDKFFSLLPAQFNLRLEWGGASFVGSNGGRTYVDPRERGDLR